MGFKIKRFNNLVKWKWHTNVSKLVPVSQELF